MDWRDALRTLQHQFEAKAAGSRGLHHLMVEVGDSERDRMKGPEWFVRDSGFGSSNPGPFLRAEPWHVVQWSNLPTVYPRFREVRPGESVEGVPPEHVIRDGSGEPRGVFEPMRLRSSYLCGDHTAVKGFQSLAETASRTLTGVTELADHEYADDLVDLFRPPRGGVRYVFGNVPDQPNHFIAGTWQPELLICEHGVLIDMPSGESAPGVGHWLLLLHRLSWRRTAGCPLQGTRLAWHDNMTIPYEWIVNREFDARWPEQWRERFARVATTSYYSILGEQDRPLDVNLASAFAIGILLATRTTTVTPSASEVGPSEVPPDARRNRQLPPLSSVDAREVRKTAKLRVVLLTATKTERDAVLKCMEPLSDGGTVAQAFQDNNTFFIGQLGQYPVVLCQCVMGGSGRDSSQNVTGELIRFWKPSAVIMVGIAYGRDPNRQRIGDVLVSERIIAYEPERIGVESSVARDQHFLAGAMLLNRFQHATVHWSFRDAAGIQCALKVGPILSGEKLIDNPDFKAQLFRTHPHAIGGEMEGVGLASAAEREKREWILVKGICDWADGEKADGSQEFAAAAAVSLVQHVLNQPGVI